MPHHLLRISLTAAVFFVLAPSAHGGTFYVGNNGLDGPSCGPKTSPCRSIGQAVNTIAAAGDSIIVGPGSYGDLNGNGTLGDSPGEEAGGFGCMVLVARGVTITSSDGAAATVIDARTVSTGCNVGILADGTQFGKTGKGFTVTNTKDVHGSGILINATNVKVRGNQVIGPGLPTSSFVGNGIDTANTAGEVILIEANQVIGWAYGIVANSDGKTVSKNQVSLSNQTGITAHAGTVVGNITSGNLVGLSVADAASASRNGVYGNALYGVWVFSTSFSGVVEGNNVFGNGSQGVHNGSASVLSASNNYWGAATGPGADPADDVGGTQPTTATPFAKKPFKVKAPIKP